MIEQKLKAKVFKYNIVQLIDLDNLKDFKNHRRLETFYHKGTQCVSCSRKGTQLGIGIDKLGNEHVDVYTDDLYPITVDHIIPISKGGNDSIDNKQPMCSGCNSKKGNGDINNKPKNRISSKNLIKLSKNPVGKTVYKRKGRSKFVLAGVVRSIEVNPHTNKLSVTLEGKENSYYNLSSLKEKLCN